MGVELRRSGIVRSLHSWIGEKRFRWMLGSVVGLTLFLLAGTGRPAEREIILGTVEDIILLPWGVKLPARIDTGAAKSSLYAKELRIQDNMAEFRLPEKYGDLELRLPIVEWRHLRTREGLERRPVLDLELCIGAKRLRTKVVLDDRSHLKYPFLVGRNTLSGIFIVNPNKRRLAPPHCEP